MILESRRTHNFVTIKTDEIETTIFKTDSKELEETINNLLDVIEDLTSYTDKTINDFVSEREY
jgi:hypothetical protein